ncbi:tenascin-like [Brachionichthys hirsutus]|uniref:tenascin-like n=1 Tax=Brachionichthys hirsutus TaxID=412623 RepID=UPI003604F710
MLLFVPSLLILLLTAAPALPTTSSSQGLQVRGQRAPGETPDPDPDPDAIKVFVSEGCGTQGDSSDATHGGKEINLTPGSPLVLTHRINLVPLGSGPCGCETDFAALKDRLERMEREVSALREKCGGAEGGCCSSEESKGPGCSIKPDVHACPNDCGDHGRCLEGRCVCFAGFSGPDCSRSNCPGNCSDNGRCLLGQCLCGPGLTGPDCSQRDCPGNCSNRGRCINGECACDDGFTGPACSDQTCPGNCSSRGRCVGGRCVCSRGFTGADCSEKACPKNCSSRGRCANGRCVCDVGFSGPNCAFKACPKNCSMKGRCIKGRCVCRRGFTGPDCSQCGKGMTGADCDTVMSGVSQLSTRVVTETSATLAWTPPPVQYDSFYITFTSKKEGDQLITVQVDGGLTGFTQTGLASGQEYQVSIAGETNGRRGAESSVGFTTLISGPTDLQVVKTTTTSAVVQWGRSQGEIDRYRMTVTPNDGSGRRQEVTVPAGQNSAHIQQLEPGRLYDIALVAEKGPSRSEPATTQVTPGESWNIKSSPEPPTNIVFSKVADNGVTVSWTKPKSPVSGFKVTYTHADEGEPVSVSASSDDSSLALSHLTPGSTYEVSVISVLGLDESDPISDFVKTFPDRPTGLRVLNVTDTEALLLWRPALAAVDKYAIVYASGSGSELRVTVSGNAAEQQLSGLEASTTYTVTVTSRLGGLESRPAGTSFTTAGGSEGGGPRDLRVTDVGPRSARLSWKPASHPTGGYKLTYRAEGREVKEVIVDSSVTDYNLPRLRPGSKYVVLLQAEGGGQSSAAVSTEFTTGSLRFPFPRDCSQELLNGVRTSGEAEVFPQGEHGPPSRVYCDMETEGGGWTVFQRRKDGSVNFFRGWKDYIEGFGDLSGEFWLGLDILHNLTTTTRTSLRIDLRDKDESAFAKYSRFEVGKKNYKLTVGGYSGTAGDSLSYHNNRVFSTKDRDPTPFITRCAVSYRGGWWYRNCHEANLNGLYGIDVKHQGVIWTTWKGKDVSIPFTEMKMRPAAFRPTRG